MSDKGYFSEWPIGGPNGSRDPPLPCRDLRALCEDAQVVCLASCEPRSCGFGKDMDRALYLPTDLMARKQRCTIISCRRVLSTSRSPLSASSPLRSYGGSPPQTRAIRCPLTASWWPDAQRPQGWVSAQRLPCCLSPAHPLCEGLVRLPLRPFASASSAGGSPPLTQHFPCTQVRRHIQQSSKLCQCSPAEGHCPASFGSVLPLSMQACSKPQPSHCLFFPAQVPFYHCPLPPWPSTGSMHGGQEDIPPREPPNKRVKTARDYARESRRPDKWSRKRAKEDGQRAQSSRPKEPSTPRRITLFSSPYTSCRPPPPPPSRTHSSSSELGQAAELGQDIPQPRTPAEEMVEILPEQDIPAPRTPQDLEVEMVNARQR